jgi:hypothetical protein
MSGQDKVFVAKWQLAELFKASVIHPRDVGSNLGTDRKYFLILFV